MSDETIVLPPGGGRAYEIGPMRGVFKAGAFNVFIPGGFEAGFAKWAGSGGRGG